MESTTHKNRVVVSLLILVGFTLTALPLSVFSQEETSTTSDAENVLQKEVQATQHTDVSSPYSVDILDGDQIIGDFVVGPGKVELSLNPGESKTVELIVTNRIGKLKAFSFEIEDASGSDDPSSAVVLLGEDRGPYTLKDYIHIPNMKFELGHNERAHIPVTISLPVDAEPGGRYGSVLVSTVSRDAAFDDEEGTSPSSAILSRIGTLFFITTPGSSDVEGELVSFETVPDKSFFLEGPIDFGLVYENTGSVHVNPYGEIHITNIAGEEVGFIELDPWFALPQSLRTREISWDRELLIGRYKAVALINRGYDDIVDEVSVTFWVIPWKLVAGVFVGLFFFFLIIRFVVTRFEFKRK